MQPEQQKRILGYFIEEAKEHLQTIEHALVNLQATVDDAETLNEVFRAAHSVKGGAAMLGIYSIQQTSHRLEDYFKLLKEHRVQVDQQLVSLFFKGFDTLQELLEELQSPFGLSNEVADAAMVKVEPVFQELHSHLLALTQGGAPAAATPASPLLLAFQTDVPEQLRQMLQLFKQRDTPQQRQQLAKVCQSLEQLGNQFDLPAWSQLLQSARQAIAQPQTTFASLAPVLIKEIKSAQELVLAGAANQIAVTPQLVALLTPPAPAQPAPVIAPVVSEPEFTAPGEDLAAELANLFGEADVPEVVSTPPVAADLELDFGDQFWADGLDLEPATETPAAAEPGFADLLAELAPPEPQSFEPEFAIAEASLTPGSDTQLDELDFGKLFQDLTGTTATPAAQAPAIDAIGATTADFADLDSLLAPATSPVADFADFADLEQLLVNTPAPVVTPSRQPAPAAPTAKSAPTPIRGVDALKPRTPRRAANAGIEQTMKVPVKQLDILGNLVGELVVNRNSMEDSQERLRQFLDNLLYQVQQLGDVGQQMQELYERSLLESSLLAANSRSTGSGNGNGNPGDYDSNENFDALEMDRFTGFHSLSQEVIERIVRVREAASDIEFVVDVSDQVTRMFRQVTTQVQEGLSRSRMMPFAQIADRLPRAVRDIALKCGKQARLEIDGKDALVDKGILERLYDPMTHLVNNAIYHGIESPETRRAVGKPEEGTIKVKAFYQGSQTIIAITDDGGGIDPERVKARAIDQGLVSPEQAVHLTRQEIYSFLFRPGFSTVTQADELAGRGVGMDVVRTSLEQIRGTITTDSTIGKGTTFTIRLPLTLSITKALCCVDNHCRVAFPMDGVEDMVDITPDRLHTNVDGKLFLPWREQLVRFSKLSDILPYQRTLNRGTVYGGTSQEEDLLSIVVLRGGDELIAIQVDQVIGEQEIVIKQLTGPVPKPFGVAGVTVQGDGRVMPIADVLELVDLCTGRLETNNSLWSSTSTVPVDPQKAEPLVLIVDDSITVRELLSLTFNKVGYRVEQARDGQEAWEKLRSGLPCDLVFCDIEMPRMDGLELLSRIQKDNTLNHLPIAMLTSRGADRHRQMAIQLGAKAYFTKPYLEEALLDAARRMLDGEVLVSAKSAVEV